MRILVLAALAVSASAFTGPAALRPFSLRNSAVSSPSSHGASHGPALRGKQPVAYGLARPAASRLGALSMSGSEITMPALSSTMKEGKIVQWTKSVGDKVASGEVVMVVESDKADMDVESFEDGYIAKIIVPEGSVAEVGSAVALIAATKEDIDKVAAGGGAAAAAPAPAAQAAPAAAPAMDIDAPAVLMPALSSTMKEGKIVQWAKQEGDKVESGDVLMVVESDKADMDVEAFEEGFLAAILVPEGEAALVGNAVAYLAPTKEDIPKVKAAAASLAGAVASAAPAPAAAAPAAAAPAAAAAASAPAAAPVRSGERIVASPLAKKMAAEKGVDLVGVAGTGPNGRIIARDVESAKPGAAGAAAPSGYRLPAGVISASPQAKKAAKANSIKIETVKGTGLGGRITENDVLAAAGKAPAAPAATTKPSREAPVLPDGPKPLSGMQAAVAKNMEATMASPSFMVSRKICTDKFDELYAALKPKGVTVSALLSKAVALTIEKHPIINAGYDPVSKSILYNKNVNIANAVAIDGGLITPVLKNANVQDILSLSADWKDLVGKAKSGSLRPDEYNSGTFTISNLGMFGVSQFGSLLPAGMGSILAIGGANPTVVMKNGQPTEVKVMEVTITCDHRHIYGADAALFLKDLAELIENSPVEIVL